MIKKFIGVVLALAVIVVIVFTALHHDKYRSMIGSRPATAAVANDAVELAPLTSADSVAMHVPDSLAQ